MNTKLIHISEHYDYHHFVYIFLGNKHISLYTHDSLSNCEATMLRDYIVTNNFSDNFLYRIFLNKNDSI